MDTTSNPARCQKWLPKKKGSRWNPRLLFCRPAVVTGTPGALHKQLFRSSSSSFSFFTIEFRKRPDSCVLEGSLFHTPSSFFFFLFLVGEKKRVKSIQLAGLK